MPNFGRKQVKAVDAEQRRSETPLDFCSRLIRAFEGKANHNKRESMMNFFLVTVAALLAPLFITLGDGIWWGKVVPSVLSLTAAGSTAWLQLRQPQRLWSIYRTAQRELEDHRTRHQYGIEPYGSTEDRDALLAEKTADIALSVHYEWLPLVPSPENLKGFPQKYQPVAHSSDAPLGPPIEKRHEVINERRISS